MKIKFKKLNEEAVMPSKGSQGAAAFDLYTCEDCFLGDKRVIAHTGIAIELPQGYVADVRPRSGISVKGVDAVTTFPDGSKRNVKGLANVIYGTIDEDYRGEIGIILDCESFGLIIPKGTRLAQLLIHQIPEIEFEEATELSDTDRGAGGYGSTGK